MSKIIDRKIETLGIDDVFDVYFNPHVSDKWQQQHQVPMDFIDKTKIFLQSPKYLLRHPIKGFEFMVNSFDKMFLRIPFGLFSESLAGTNKSKHIWDVPYNVFAENAHYDGRDVMSAMTLGTIQPEEIDGPVGRALSFATEIALMPSSVASAAGKLGVIPDKQFRSVLEFERSVNKFFFDYSFPGIRKLYNKFSPSKISGMLGHTQARFVRQGDEFASAQEALRQADYSPEEIIRRGEEFNNNKQIKIAMQKIQSRQGAIPRRMRDLWKQSLNVNELNAMLNEIETETVDKLTGRQLTLNERKLKIADNTPEIFRRFAKYVKKLKNEDTFLRTTLHPEVMADIERLAISGENGIKGAMNDVLLETNKFAKVFNKVDAPVLRDAIVDFLEDQNSHSLARLKNELQEVVFSSEDKLKMMDNLPNYDELMSTIDEAEKQYVKAFKDIVNAPENMNKFVENYWTERRALIDKKIKQGNFDRAVQLITEDLDDSLIEKPKTFEQLKGKLDTMAIDARDTVNYETLTSGKKISKFMEKELKTLEDMGYNPSGVEELWSAYKYMFETSGPEFFETLMSNPNLKMDVNIDIMTKVYLLSDLYDIQKQASEFVEVFETLAEVQMDYNSIPEMVMNNNKYNFSSYFQNAINEKISLLPIEKQAGRRYQISYNVPAYSMFDNMNSKFKEYKKALSSLTIEEATKMLGEDLIVNPMDNHINKTIKDGFNKKIKNELGPDAKFIETELTKIVEKLKPKGDVKIDIGQFTKDVIAFRESGAKHIIKKDNWLHRILASKGTMYFKGSATQARLLANEMNILAKQPLFIVENESEFDEMFKKDFMKNSDGLVNRITINKKIPKWHIELSKFTKKHAKTQLSKDYHIATNEIKTLDNSYIDKAELVSEFNNSITDINKRVRSKYSLLGHGNSLHLSEEQYIPHTVNENLTDRNKIIDGDLEQVTHEILEDNAMYGVVKTIMPEQSFLMSIDEANNIFEPEKNKLLFEQHDIQKIIRGNYNKGLLENKMVKDLFNVVLSPDSSINNIMSLKTNGTLDLSKLAEFREYTKGYEDQVSLVSYIIDKNGEIKLKNYGVNENTFNMIQLGELDSDRLHLLDKSLTSELRRFMANVSLERKYKSYRLLKDMFVTPWKFSILQSSGFIISNFMDLAFKSNVRNVAEFGLMNGSSRTIKNIARSMTIAKEYKIEYDMFIDAMVRDNNFAIEVPDFSTWIDKRLEARSITQEQYNRISSYDKFTKLPGSMTELDQNKRISDELKELGQKKERTYDPKLSISHKMRIQKGLKFMSIAGEENTLNIGGKVISNKLANTFNGISSGVERTMRFSQFLNQSELTNEFLAKNPGILETLSEEEREIYTLVQQNSAILEDSMNFAEIPFNFYASSIIFPFFGFKPKNMLQIMRIAEDSPEYLQYLGHLHSNFWRDNDSNSMPNNFARSMGYMPITKRTMIRSGALNSAGAGISVVSNPIQTLKTMFNPLFRPAIERGNDGFYRPVGFSHVKSTVKKGTPEYSSIKNYIHGVNPYDRLFTKVVPGWAEAAQGNFRADHIAPSAFFRNSQYKKSR